MSFDLIDPSVRSAACRTARRAETRSLESHRTPRAVTLSLALGHGCAAMRQGAWHTTHTAATLRHPGEAGSRALRAVGRATHALTPRFMLGLGELADLADIGNAGHLQRRQWWVLPRMHVAIAETADGLAGEAASGVVAEGRPDPVKADRQRWLRTVQGPGVLAGQAPNCSECVWTIAMEDLLRKRLDGAKAARASCRLRSVSCAKNQPSRSCLHHFGRPR